MSLCSALSDARLYWEECVPIGRSHSRGPRPWGHSEQRGLLMQSECALSRPPGVPATGDDLEALHMSYDRVRGFFTSLSTLLSFRTWFWDATVPHVGICFLARVIRLLSAPLTAAFVSCNICNKHPSRSQKRKRLLMVCRIPLRRLPSSLLSIIRKTSRLSKPRSTRPLPTSNGLVPASQVVWNPGKPTDGSGIRTHNLPVFVTNLSNRQRMSALACSTMTLVQKNVHSCTWLVLSSYLMKCTARGERRVTCKNACFTLPAWGKWYVPVTLRAIRSLSLFPLPLLRLLFRRNIRSYCLLGCTGATPLWYQGRFYFRLLGTNVILFGRGVRHPLAASRSYHERQSWQPFSYIQTWRDT